MRQKALFFLGVVSKVCTASLEIEKNGVVVCNCVPTRRLVRKVLHIFSSKILPDHRTFS